MGKTSGAFAFPKTRRLLRPADYQRVFDNVDCKQGGKYCTLLSARNAGTDSRLGMIVAKRNLRHAVDRNRLKRLIREFFRQRNELQTVDIDSVDSSFDVIVLVKATTRTATNQEIRRELERQWSKLITKRLELAKQRG